MPPPHRARRRHAVEQRAGAAQHFHPLHADQRRRIARRQAIQAVVRHVVVEDGKATDVELLPARIAAVGVAHRGVVDQHIANGLCLLVVHQLGGVLGGTEGRVHHIAVAQQPDLAAARDLAARIGAGQTFQGGCRDRDGGQHHGTRRVCRCGGRCRRCRRCGPHQHRTVFDRALQAAAGQQTVQCVLRRQLARYGGRRLARDQSGREAQLQIALACQLIERLGEWLRCNRKTACPLLRRCRCLRMCRQRLDSGDTQRQCGCHGKGSGAKAEKGRGAQHGRGSWIGKGKGLCAAHSARHPL